MIDITKALWDVYVGHFFFFFVFFTNISNTIWRKVVSAVIFYEFDH